jgi:hypothetical protein
MSSLFLFCATSVATGKSRVVENLHYHKRTGLTGFLFLGSAHSEFVKKKFISSKQ